MPPKTPTAPGALTPNRPCPEGEAEVARSPAESANSRAEPVAVGTRLWMVPQWAYMGQPREVQVAYVGRTWIHLKEPGASAPSQWWADRETLRLKGGAGRCYRSEAEYRDQLDRQAAWDAVRKVAQEHYGPPVGVSSDSIKRALGILLGSADGPTV